MGGLRNFLDPRRFGSERRPAAPPDELLQRTHPEPGGPLAR